MCHGPSFISPALMALLLGRMWTRALFAACYVRPAAWEKSCKADQMVGIGNGVSTTCGLFRVYRGLYYPVSWGL